MLKLFHFGPVGTPSYWLLPAFDVSPSFLEGFLTSLHTKMAQAHLLLSLSESWTRSFLQGALIPLIREEYLETMIDQGAARLVPDEYSLPGL